MRTITISRGMLVGLGLLAALSMTACTASKAPSGAGSGNSHTVSPAASTPASSPPTAAPSTTPTTPGGVRNLVISTAVRGDLTAAFVAHKGISSSDVAGTYPGSVYYAYDPATGTYWAMAQFKASSTASMNVLVELQDGGNIGLYRKAGTGPWQVQTQKYPPMCTEPRFFPKAVLTAWSLPTTIPADLNGYHC